MAKNRHLTAAAALAAALLVSPTTARAAAPEPEPGSMVLDWVVTLKSGTKPLFVHDGDTWSLYGHLHERTEDRGPGTKIGDMTARCTAVLVHARGHVRQCERVLRTDAGHLSLTDAMDVEGTGPHGAPGAVTGGTGVYADAEGEARITEHGGTAGFRITLDD
ncbi:MULTISPECIES: hypothetical protein [unclassified Streptomyces]|uniref:hypothetical protein n=1 Tax=unclassified Streptomyces TaxID=2593676 RepID=UPI0008DD3EF2|nr:MULTISPECIES: hypothetical protein [unclassified Streptomyces]OII68992.1 hypothetical protein BJP39_19120 [Streptomyces sp. CC77]